MVEALNQAGDFRGRITGYGLYKPDSGAVAVDLTVAIDEAWDNESKTWSDWRQYELVVAGYIWIIKKTTGETIQRNIQSLLNCAGWDGDMTSVESGRWQAQPIQISVEPDEYKGNTRYRIAWVNEYNHVPGGGNVTAEEAKALQQQYGSKIRALASNSQRATTAPQGTVPAKPAPAQPAPAQPASAQPAPVQAAPAPAQPAPATPAQPAQPAPAQPPVAQPAPVQPAQFGPDTPGAGAGGDIPF